MVTRRRLLPAVLVAATLMAGTARETRASVDFESSMTASCQNAACDLIRFVLSVPDQVSGGIAYTNAMVDIVRIYALKSAFDFGAVVGVWNANGSLIPGAWSSSISSDPFNAAVEIALAGGTLASQPIYLLVSMTTSTPSSLYDGSLTYFANGAAGFGSGGTGFSTQGQVTPEPITLILLGSGLLGVGGAARRRRRKIELESI